MDSKYKNLVKKLLGLKKKILLTSKSALRDALIYNYFALYKFLSEAGIIKFNEEDLIDESDNYFFYTIINLDNNVNELGKLLPNLKEKFSELLDFYHERNFYSINNYQDGRINSDLNGEILDSFFKYLGEDIYEIYQRIILEDKVLISFLTGNLGVTYKTRLDVLSPVIISSKDDNIFFLNTLVHEIGHVYHINLRKNMTDNYSNNMVEEVISMLFEKLFLKFLQDNHLLNDAADYLKKYNQYASINFFAIGKLICEINDKKEIIVNFDSLLIDHDLSEEEIIERLTKDCGHPMFYEELSFYSLYYAIGDIISSYFFYKILNNKEECMRELRDFAVTKLNCNEVFERYLKDLTPMKMYIDEQINNEKTYIKVKN